MTWYAGPNPIFIPVGGAAMPPWQAEDVIAGWEDQWGEGGDPFGGGLSQQIPPTGGGGGLDPGAEPPSEPDDDEWGDLDWWTPDAMMWGIGGFVVGWVVAGDDHRNLGALTGLIAGALIGPRLQGVEAP